MKSWKRFLFFVLAFGIIALSGCSEYQEVLKSTDTTLKLQKAKEYYDAGLYYKALPLFEDLINFYKGTKEMEDISYYYAYTHFHLNENLLAAYYFKNFSITYPYNEHAEECLFMNAKCYYILSPDIQLEQSYTEKAIGELQLFVNQYPSGKYVPDANQMIDDMRRKLDLKAYKSAELYFKMGRYSASSVAFKNLLHDYPDSPYIERAMFMIIKSNYLYALNSVPSKQRERYQTTLDSYQIFANKYAGSSYMNEAKDLYETTNKNITKIKTDEQE
ncbi:MAG: outer membrane protein assembly factor BamD [Chitinophagaceae bacterium]|nr:outer membrane protein assembly factor BamD [Chitinophagaceae bacterium]